jgi:hypothetical protein
MLAAALLMTLVLQAASEGDPKDEAVRLAQQALVDAFGSGVEAASVESVLAAEWRDSGLGCPPVKGEIRQPVVTSGFRVRLRVAEEVHEVHVAGDRARICAPAAAGAYVTAALRVSNLARKELAARLGVTAKEVRVESIKPITWPNRNLGCGPGADEKVPDPVKGFVIALRHGGKEYRYNADTERVVSCP